MKRMDILLILVVLLAAGGLYFFFFAGAEEGGFVRITVDGEEQKKVPMAEDTVFTVETGDGINTVQIQDGTVFMASADCRDQICVEHKKIHRTGETIVCLPHKLVVEVIGAGEKEVDMVVG